MTGSPFTNGQEALAACLEHAPVIPVVVLENFSDAAPLAEALVDGGLPVIEVTLRTPCALQCIEALAKIPGVIVGAGTILDAIQLREATEAGARFAVSPGAYEALLDAASTSTTPLLPGIATASEAMALIARGYRFAKFFPAGAAGGPNLLKALASPLPQLKFCPTGGVSLENARDYLSLPNVACVGGSWMVKPETIARGGWSAVKEAAAKASALRRAVNALA